MEKKLRVVFLLVIIFLLFCCCKFCYERYKYRFWRQNIKLQTEFGATSAHPGAPTVRWDKMKCYRCGRKKMVHEM